MSDEFDITSVPDPAAGESVDDVTEEEIDADNRKTGEGCILIIILTVIAFGLFMRLICFGLGD